MQSVRELFDFFDHLCHGMRQPNLCDLCLDLLLQHLLLTHSAALSHPIIIEASQMLLVGHISDHLPDLVELWCEGLTLRCEHPELVLQDLQLARLDQNLGAESQVLPVTQDPFLELDKWFFLIFDCFEVFEKYFVAIVLGGVEVGQRGALELHYVILVLHSDDVVRVEFFVLTGWKASLMLE